MFHEYEQKTLPKQPQHQGVWPDFRQAIADSWPGSIDDSAARKDWGWKEKYNLEKMTQDMIHHLSLALLKK